ncbi:MAG: DUF3124 domain-containing protein [Desulfosarcina sp.]|nr:DUF3124 domain-containing protein [Desulfobacterales bacterium]
MPMKRHILRTIVTVALLTVTLCANGTSPATAQSTQSKGQTLYVPIYSHIYSGNREHPIYLAATVSIRNTDPIHAIQLVTVDYFNSEGKLLKRYLKKTVTLKPMASTRYIVSESDKAGGSGANFIIRWESDEPVNAPITESIMISTASQLGISFTSRGQVVKE